MDSCARRSNSVRSPGECSKSEGSTDSPGLGGGCDIAIRLRRGHGLSAPAQDEGTAAALYHAPVDLRPEGHKIINRRHQRDTHHEPDREIGDPVDGEDVVAIDWPFLPAMVEDDGDDGNDLHHHLELAEIAGFDGETF